MAVTGKEDFPFLSSWGRGRGRGRGTTLLYTPIFSSGRETARATTWLDWFFEAGTPPSGSTGQIKVYNGTTFTAKPVKWYNGSTWVIKPLKRWSGSAWIITPY